VKEASMLAQPPALRVMTALHRGIPLTLLCDLADPEGPASHSIYRTEGRVGAALAMTALTAPTAATCTSGM
jgi:hypothetical protein